MHPAQIAAALTVAGYKQIELASELGVAPTTVGAVIHGRSRSKQVEERVSAITGHTLEELWPQWHGQEQLVLTDEERALVLLYRELPPAARGQVLPVVREMTRDVRGNAPRHGGAAVSDSGRYVVGSGNARVAGGNYNEGASRKPRRK